MIKNKKPYRIEGRPQTIYRVVKSADNPFVMIDRRPIDNPALSFKAKGILTYLMSRPDGWEVSVTDLVNHSIDGDDSVRSGLKELRKAGHMKQTRTRESGRITGFLIEVYELPHADLQDMEKPDMENPTQVISNSNKTKRKKNKERLNDDDEFSKSFDKSSSSSFNDSTQIVCNYWTQNAGKNAPKALHAAISRTVKFAERIGLPRGQYLTDIQSLIEKTFLNDSVNSHSHYMTTCLETLRHNYEINYRVPE
jgi:hypothetical protein